VINSNFRTRLLSTCSFGLSATSHQYFSLRTNQPSVTSQQYFYLRTNQHQPSATSQTNTLYMCVRFESCTAVRSKSMLSSFTSVRENGRIWRCSRAEEKNVLHFLLDRRNWYELRAIAYSRLSSSERSRLTPHGRTFLSRWRVAPRNP
jgi:hypothetical protein